MATEQANVLPLEKTVMETMEDAATSTDYEQLRALLGAASAEQR